MAIGRREYKKDANGRLEIDGVSITGEVNVDLDILQGTLDDQLFLGNSVQAAIGVDGSATATRLLTDTSGRLLIKITDGTETLLINASGSAGVDLTDIDGNAVNVGAGAVSTGTLRMTLASDDPAVVDLAAIEIVNTAIQTAVEIMDDWNAVHDSAVGADGCQEMLEARSARGTAVASGDAVRGTANLYGERVIAGYSWAGNNIRTGEVDPLDQKYVAETLAAITNGADDTYYYYVDMAGFRYSAYQLTLSGGSGTCTVTIEASMQDDGTAPASCAYQDVTNDVFGAANFTATDYLVDNDQVLASAKYVRVKVVAATGDADDADWTIYHKRWW